jgi:hypothetical protein
MAALCASRWSAIGCIAGRTKNLSKKEGLKAHASRWSAVGCTNGTTKKNGLTRAGLLMEVARNPLALTGGNTFVRGDLAAQRRQSAPLSRPGPVRSSG